MHSSSSALCLFCAAQGYPVPITRSDLKEGTLSRFFCFFSPHTFSEPVGGARPRFSTDSKGTVLERISGIALTMLCPGQGFPVPTFRYRTCCVL